MSVPVRDEDGVIAGMTVPAAQQDPVLRRYPLRRLKLPMARGTLSVVVPDLDAWLATREGGQAASTAAARGAEPQYWATVWPAAVALASWLSRRQDLAGLDVLDLGCGLGLPGAAAVRAGARVVLADSDASALRFARFNAQQAAAASGGDCRSASVATQQVDWRSETLSTRADVLCLSDVTYRPCHHLPVLRHLDCCVRPEGLAVHCEPFREESVGFLRLAEERWSSRAGELSPYFQGRRHAVRCTFLARSEHVLDCWLDGGRIGAHGLDASGAAHDAEASRPPA
jgi:predicted nicotinamide N-methyase